jgi:hypothetical protein
LEQVPDIVQIVGGEAAVAEQAAEFRRLEQQRLNHAAQGAARLAPPAFPARPAARIRPIQPFHDLIAAQAREAQERRERDLLEARRELEARRRQAEENRRWCVIM